MNLQAAILAGGLGTRIKSLFPEIPKPMIPINGTPFIELQMNSLYSCGVTDFVLCLGYKSDVIIDYFSKKSLPYTIKFSTEKEQLGTGGAILNALHFLSDEFMIVNGDTYVTFSAQDLKKFHDAKQSDCTILLVSRQDVSDYGSVIVDNDEHIVKFTEKGATAKDDSHYVNAGVYLVKKAIFNALEKKVFSLERDLFPQLAHQKKIYGFLSVGKFIDIGTTERFFDFKALMEKNSRPL